MKTIRATSEFVLPSEAVFCVIQRTDPDIVKDDKTRVPGKYAFKVQIVWTFMFILAVFPMVCYYHSHTSGRQLWFAEAHHKNTRKRKGGRCPGLGELPKIWGFPFNIY